MKRSQSAQGRNNRLLGVVKGARAQQALACLPFPQIDASAVLYDDKSDGIHLREPYDPSSVIVHASPGEKRRSEVHQTDLQAAPARSPIVFTWLEPDENPTHLHLATTESEEDFAVRVSKLTGHIWGKSRILPPTPEPVLMDQDPVPPSPSSSEASVSFIDLSKKTSAPILVYSSEDSDELEEIVEEEADIEATRPCSVLVSRLESSVLEEVCSKPVSAQARPPSPLPDVATGKVNFVIPKKPPGVISAHPFISPLLGKEEAKELVIESRLKEARKQVEEDMERKRKEKKERKKEKRRKEERRKKEQEEREKNKKVTGKEEIKRNKETGVKPIGIQARLDAAREIAKKMKEEVKDRVQREKEERKRKAIATRVEEDLRKRSEKKVAEGMEID